MHTEGPVDPGRSIDWSLTATDYAAHRPGPPARLYDMLAALGVGLPGQRLLDIGTGTGLVAREFARRGARVCGTDSAAGQIDAARAEAAREGLAVDFRVAPAEACPHADASFDVVTATQFNPAWRGAGWSGEVPAIPPWSVGRAEVQAMFWFDIDVPFTHERWRGRLRACRGVGATLNPAEVEAFDAAHAQLLTGLVPERFTVRHRIDAHLLRLR